MADYSVPQTGCKIVSQHDHRYSATAGDGVDSSALPPFNLTPHHLETNKGYYGIRIVTGQQLCAGTMDNAVYITLIGNKASSGKVCITKCLKVFSELSSSQTYDDLVIETDKDLGTILVVILSNDKGWNWCKVDSPWFVDFVMVHNFQSKATDQFPCYHWIGGGDSVSFTAHTTTLADVENDPILVHQRQAQLDKRRGQYKWKSFPYVEMPAGIDDSVSHLPAEERFDAAKSIDFTADAVKAGAALGIKGATTTLNSLSKYEKLAETMGLPEVPIYQAGRWTRDEEFGYQMLNAVNPVVIQKCTSLPKKFPVTNEMVQGSLSRGLSLEEETKAGHVYMCDLEIMDGLPCRKDRYCPAPICLLYVNGNNQLVPIAIQLKQQPGEDNPIFLPTDNWIDWLMAKIYYQNAHAQYHQLITHYTCCHAAMETYGMGTMRNLPDPHPIFKLLQPHFRYTMAINTRARKTLINNGGIIDQTFGIRTEGRRQLMRRGGHAYNVHWTNIKRSVKERGVDDPKQLPGYYYRDDGLKVWQAIEDFARDIISEFYSSDSHVAEDKELQNWASDIHTNGFIGYNGAATGHGFPEQVTTVEDLVELCTLIMFTGSAQHAAVNFGQYNYYSFVANAPLTVHSPPLTRKGEADYQTLLDALPHKLEAVLLITTVYTLSQNGPKEKYLKHYNGERFTEKRAQRMVERFQESLSDITGDILERNKKLDVPYTFLLPSKIPNSITI